MVRTVMADVKTESLKAVDNNISTKPTINVRTDKMTVEKQVVQPAVLKNKSTVKSDDTPSVTQAQLKAAPGNAPPSPKKSDSPILTGLLPKTPVQQQGKVKVNPWHKTAAPGSGGVGKKGSAPEGSDAGTSSSGSTSPKEDTSKSIQIPIDEVCCMV